MNTKIAFIAALGALSPIASSATSTFVAEVPASLCPTTAPTVGCVRTLPLDLRGVTRFQFSIQAINFGQINSPAVVQLQDTASLTCFGVVCPTITIPAAAPALGSCCPPTFLSPMIFVPVSQRRQNVRLRIAVSGGNLHFENTQKPLVQFYTN